MIKNKIVQLHNFEGELFALTDDGNLYIKVDRYVDIKTVLGGKKKGSKYKVHSFVWEYVENDIARLKKYG